MTAMALESKFKNFHGESEHVELYKVDVSMSMYEVDVPMSSGTQELN